MGCGHSQRNTTKHTTDEFLASRGLFRIDEIPTPLLTFQKRANRTYTIVGNRVEKSYTAADFTVDDAKDS